jgi:hypothetical protein
MKVVGKYQDFRAIWCEWDNTEILIFTDNLYMAVS